jgi:hypothetical protein
VVLLSNSGSYTCPSPSVPFGWRVGSNKELIEDVAPTACNPTQVKLRKQGKAPRAIAAALGTEGFTLSHFEVQKIIDGATDEGDP